MSGGVTAKSNNKEQWALHLESAHDMNGERGRNNHLVVKSKDLWLVFL